MTVPWPPPLPAVGTAPAPARMPPTRQAERTRIEGVDLARALAIAGMVVAHYVERDPDGGSINAVRAFVDGRAMSLFVVLFGVSVALMARRQAHPDRALVVRAAVFLPLGLALQEWTVGIAIILQYYALYALATVVLRRLGDRMLLAGAALVTAAGAVTYQLVGPRWPGYTAWQGGEGVLPPWGVLANLTVNGYYPALPTLAFVMIGLWLGRRNLADERVARRLVVVGAALGAVGYVGGRAVARVSDYTRDALDPRVASFDLRRIFDTAGHSQMPAWVLGATGVSCAALGLCLLVAARWPRLVEPFVATGQLALSVYVAQALLVCWTPPLPETTIGEEAVIATVVFVGLGGAAWLWRRSFGRGPLEAAVHALARRR